MSIAAPMLVISLIIYAGLFGLCNREVIAKMMIRKEEQI